MKKRIIIPLTIIVIILTLAILSITIKSVNWDVDEISEVTSTTELARLISLHPDKFWNASVSEIFNRNTRKRSNGTYGLDGNERDDIAKYVDIYYHTAACIFHDQTNRNGDGYAHKITNIIEIESPGIMTVHKWTGDSKNPTHESAILDFTTEGSARAIFDKMKKDKIIDSSETFNYDNIKKDITAFAYLINQTTQNAQNANPVASESYAYTNTKNAIHYFWKQPGGTIPIRKYAKASGKLDSYYYNAQGQNDEVTAEATKKRADAIEAAAAVIEPATLIKLPTSAEGNSLTILDGVENKAYIGPLKVKYTGGTPTIKINIGTSTENWITTNEWVTYDSAQRRFNDIQTGAVTSEQEFYAVTDKSNVEGLSIINVKLELEYTKYSAKLALTTSRTNDSQNLMFYMGKQEQKVIPVDWQDEISKKLEIQKQDENGNPLRQAGIKFEVYDEAGTLVGTLTTRNDGIISSVGLKPNTVYIIREIVNNAYGYKNASIEDATITGGTILENTGEQIKVKITEDAVLIVKNSPELGKLTIEKVDENGNAMPGVEFVIWQTYKGYLSIDGQTTHTTTLEGTNMKAMHENNQIVYPEGDTTDEKLAQATRYVTNGEGKIVLDNLEIYHAKGKKYEYIIREMSNGNYGYKGMVMTNDDIDLSEANESDIQGALVQDMYSGDDVKDGGKDALRKKAQFTIGRDTTVTVANEPKLGNLIVHKKDKNKNLENVEFTLYKAVSENAGYIRLIKDSQFIQTINTEIDITDYEVEYVDVDKVDEATVFKTNEDGKIIINNLEIYSGIDENYNPVKYDYWLTEQANNEYGYKDMTMTVEGVTSEGGTIIEINPELREIQFTLNETTTPISIIIPNLQKVANLAIEKVNKPTGNLNMESEPLENVEFVIERGKGDYILLKDSNGKVVKKVKGTATINVDENFETTEYSIEYVNSKEIATRFVTGEDGKIIINNLEVYLSKTEKYSYTAYEVANDNYGYGSVENENLTGTITELKLDETNTIKLENAKYLGNFSIIKHDEYDERMVLANVGFVIEQTSEARGNVVGKYAYLALYDEEGKFQPRITGDVTINKNNKAKTVKKQKEYEVRYYYTELPYEKLSNEQKAQITTFVTDDNGNMSVENLEVYSPLLRNVSTEQNPNANKYTYRLIETSNENNGFMLLELVETKFSVDSESDTTQNIANPQTTIKISGYVWIENSSGKSSEYDLKYTENNEDIKLTDLYKVQEGQLIKNPEAKIPVQIILRDKLTKKIIKTQPDQFDEHGKYTFTDVEIANLENYEVVFVYNGVYYTTILPNLEENNGSKAKEVETKRKELNNKFGKVKYGNEVVSTDGNTVNTLEYIKNGRASSVSKFNFDTTVEANTGETEMNLKKEYTNLKDKLLESLEAGETTNQTIDTIDNVNVGLILRNQSALTLGTNIYSVEVEVNNSKYTYYYAGRNEHDKNVNGDEVGVQFEQDRVPRYTQTVYSSDVEALENGSATMNVSIIYAVSITNNETSLTSVVHEIENYFDGDYTIEEIGLSLGENDEILDKVNVIAESDNVQVTNMHLQQEGKTYHSARIQLGENGMTLQRHETKKIYIKFGVSQQAIKDLLKEKSTYHNASEIMSYSTYYNEITGKRKANDGEMRYVTTERGEVGENYASINRNTSPGNIELILEKHKDERGETPVLNKEKFEDDEYSAPSLLLVAENARTIEGIVWEDLPTSESLERNERLGDGIYDKKTEKPIQNVLVALRVINEEDGSIGEIAEYSNKTLAIAETDENGKYVLGYYDEEKDENVGILPGKKYIIEYTYGKYLQGEEQKESYIVGKEVINPIDYKSTIVASEQIKNAFEDEGNDRWFATEDNNLRYSNVLDVATLRPEYDEVISEEFKGATIKYHTANTYYSNFIKMSARTPIMDIGVEFTEKDETNALETERMTTLENVDFGIIERPLVYMEVKKEITGLEILAQNGASIIPMGNPSDINSKMQYVKKLDSTVTAEIDPKLLQGATLNLEYTITVDNKSNKDYYELEYYYYGTGGETSIEPKPIKVVDYLQDTMMFDENKNQEGIWGSGTGEKLDEDGYIADYVLEDLNKNKWKVFTTDAFKDVGANQTGQVKMYATRSLATSDNIREENNVEIIELKGTRTIKGSWPGNYQPSAEPKELDEDDTVIPIIPPTGTTVNYTLYIIAAVVTLTIVGIGILIIKKKVIK